MRIQKIITFLLLACLALPVVAQKNNSRKKPTPTTTTTRKTTPKRTTPTTKKTTKPDSKPVPKPNPKPVEPKPTPKPEPQLTGYIASHEYVDLGLPSGLKWATCNVGASSPSDFGNYYAWGETSTKSIYTESNSQTYGKTLADISGAPAYDAARANWGDSWRLPTKAEFDELRNRCTWTWTGQGGHYGYQVKGPNGKSIFLPAAGYRYGTSLGDAGEYGYYWSSTPFESRSKDACSFFFISGGREASGNLRYVGLPVRAVSE